MDGTTNDSGTDKIKTEEQKLTETFTKLKDEMLMMLSPIKFMESGLLRMVTSAEGLDAAFLSSRTRLVEMMNSVTEAAPKVIEMGGEFADAAKTMAEAAGAQRRNVIETKETVSELFSASKILNKDVGTIVTNFDKVGINASRVGENLAEGINKVQKMGMNARNVMNDVLSQTEALTRYNFSEGVLGLTKMAAQAALLRFDMKETFEFAEDVLDPDRAVEMAGAFQRLGVNIGNLTDPFQLMNQSLTDPSGLQTSLIEMTKQFTYFDEDAKQFKINPQGILTMNELSKATGISLQTLRETALATASLDDRLRALSRSKISEQLSEDDQKLLANIAKMDEQGDYVVTVGKDQQQVRLDQLTQTQIEELLKETKTEKEEALTIEEYQKRSLDTAKNMAADIGAMNATIQKGIFGEGKVQELTKSMLEGLRGATKEFTKVENSEVGKIITKLKEDLKAGKEPEVALKTAQEGLEKAGKDFLGGVKETLEKASKGNETLRKSFDTLFSIFGELPKKPRDVEVPTGGGSRSVNPSGEGVRTVGITSPGGTSAVASVSPIVPSVIQNTVSGKVDVAGTVVVKVDSPSNIGQDQLRTIFETAQDPLRATVYDMVENERKKRLGIS